MGPKVEVVQGVTRRERVESGRVHGSHLVALVGEHREQLVQALLPIFTKLCPGHLQVQVLQQRPLPVLPLRATPWNALSPLDDTAISPGMGTWPLTT